MNEQQDGRPGLPPGDASGAETAPKLSLVELFSALRGVDLDLDRDRDLGRHSIADTTNL